MSPRHHHQKPDCLIGNAHTEAANPTSSWWTGIDRADFSREVAAQTPRMRRSKFGNLDSPTYGDED